MENVSHAVINVAIPLLKVSSKETKSESEADP